MDEKTLFNYSLLDCLIAQDSSFFMFRSPFKQTIELAIFKPGDVHSFLDVHSLNGKEGFVITPFIPAENHPVILLSNPHILTGETSIFRWLSSFEGTRGCRDNQSFMISNDSFKAKATYRMAFNRLRNELKAGHCDKVVLSRMATIQKTAGFSIGKTFKSACIAYPEAFVYLCHTPVSGTWLGSTPETLLSGHESTWQTVALAGTKKRTEVSCYQDWDDKNKYEQRIVSSYIENIMKSSGFVYTKTEPVSVEAGELTHLKTTFDFQMIETSHLGDVLDQLYPTPAVCGFPKEKAKLLILENEGYDRFYYGGFIGSLSVNGQTELFVNIRCLSVGNDTLTLYAGGGLLPSSDVETEWEETEAKLRTMFSLIDH